MPRHQMTEDELMADRPCAVCGQLFTPIYEHEECCDQNCENMMAEDWEEAFDIEAEGI